MARCELWVRLKVIDLVAQTAWMTLTEKLGLERELLGLVRYAFWGMEIETKDAGGAMTEIDQVIRLDILPPTPCHGEELDAGARRVLPERRKLP